MSAWIVSQAHIDCLVQSLINEGIVERDDATKVGKELWRENHRSVNYRYGERTRTPNYVFQGTSAPLDAAIVYKQVACYEYQTCERSDWEKSVSFRLTQLLRERLLGHLGLTQEEFYNDPRWNQGAWGISSLKEAEVIAVPDSPEDLPRLARVGSLPSDKEEAAQEGAGVTLDMERIAQRVNDAGYAAYVEQTGGGVATILASRTWEESDGDQHPAYRTDYPEGQEWLVEYQHYDVAAGPGWFEGPGWTRPFATSGEFFVGLDDQGASQTEYRNEEGKIRYADGPLATTLKPTDGEDEAVAAIIRALVGLDAAKREAT